MNALWNKHKTPTPHQSQRRVFGRSYSAAAKPQHQHQPQRLISQISGYPLQILQQIQLPPMQPRATIFQVCRRLRLPARAAGMLTAQPQQKLPASAHQLNQSPLHGKNSPPLAMYPFRQATRWLLPLSNLLKHPHQLPLPRGGH